MVGGWWVKTTGRTRGFTATKQMMMYSYYWCMIPSVAEPEPAGAGTFWHTYFFTRAGAGARAGQKKTGAGAGQKWTGSATLIVHTGITFMFLLRLPSQIFH